MLIILPWLPYPCNTGGNQAVFNEIEAIRNDINVHLMCHSSPKYQEYKKILQCLWPNVTIDLYPKLDMNISEMDCPQFLHKLSSKIEEKFYRSSSHKYKVLLEMSFKTIYEGRWKSYIEGLVAKYRVDIIQSEFVNSLGVITALPDNIKKVFVHHELRWVRNELLLSREKETSSLLPYKLYYDALEIGFCNMYDAVITLSDVDAQKLKEKKVTSRVFPSFAIVRNDYEFKPVEFFNNRITFVGPESHQPNKNGVDWFLENVWDKVLANKENMYFDIIGNWTKETKVEYETKYRNIRFLGFVENLQEALTGSIMVVPILIGSGIRMKIQEAANMGIPFVTTTVGVEGLPFCDDQDCYIADEEDAFADAIIKMQDISSQIKFVNSAKKKIDLTFSIQELTKSRIGIYNQLLNGK